MTEPCAGAPDETVSADGPPPVLVFVDIPECRGGVLDAGLPVNVSKKLERRPLAEMFVGGGGIRPRDMELLRRSARKLSPKGLRILRGRFPLGISVYLARLADKRQLRYITFLREPVDRTVAEYLRASEAPIDGRAHAGARVSLDAALQSHLVHDNLQTRMLSGELETWGEVTDDMLEAAKRNLSDRFEFFGLAERADESIMLARARLGLSDDLYRSQPLPPCQPEVSQKLRRKAERINAYDLELYRHATELFDRAPEFSDLEFQVGLAMMRASWDEAESEAETPRPQSFGGGEEEWRMLIEARTAILRLEWELAEDPRPKATLRVAAAAQAESDG